MFQKTIMWENIIVIHSIFKKNYKATFSTSSILKKKIDKDNFRKIITKKNTWGNIIAIESVFF